MSLDRNKTAVTHRATATAIAYLAARGFKPIETEVEVLRGWIADVASYVYPSNTELMKLKLFEHKKKLRFTTIDMSKIQEFHGIHGQGPFTAIIEVKVSRGDYLHDRESKFAGHVFPAHLCYLAYPKGLVESPPKGWTGLVLNAKCDRLIKVEQCSAFFALNPQPLGQVINVIAEVGIRRHHRTAYAAMRDWSKMHRAEEAKKKTCYTVQRSLQLIHDYIFGDSDKLLEEHLAWYGEKQEYVRDEIKRIAEKLKNLVAKKGDKRLTESKKSAER